MKVKRKNALFEIIYFLLTSLYLNNKIKTIYIEIGDVEDEEYIKELNKKLLEEAHEFIEENAVEELADIMEVIQSIMRAKNISYEELKKVQVLKREQKGGFNDRVYLIDVEQDKVDEREEQEMKKDWRKNTSDER